MFDRLSNPGDFVIVFTSNNFFLSAWFDVIETIATSDFRYMACCYGKSLNSYNKLKVIIAFLNCACCYSKSTNYNRLSKMSMLFHKFRIIEAS
jgi:hypothetical protein